MSNHFFYKGNDKAYDRIGKLGIWYLASKLLDLYCTCIKFHGLIFRVFDWQENSWGINFHDHGGMVGTIILRFAKYASYGGLIFVDRGMPRNPQKFIHLKNFSIAFKQA